MTAAPNLFRQSAVTAAAEASTADEPLRIIRPRMWIAGIGLVGLIVAALLWSLFFRIPITVPGRGILLAAGGMVDVSADAGGQIREIMVRPGDTLAEGQIIARVEQPDVRLKLSIAEGELRDAQRLRATIGTLQGEDNAAQGAYRALRGGALSQKVEALQKQRAALTDRVEAIRKLVGRGIVTRDRLDEANIAVINIDGQIADAVNERSQLSTQARTSQSDRKREMFEAVRRAADAERNVAALREQLGRTGVVRSSFAGRVVEIKASVGQSVSPGTSILTVERGARGSHGLPMAILFVSASDGKKLRPGMRVDVSPSTSRKEEDGTLIGRVVRVSDTPASTAGMLRRLQNDQLVQSFTQALGAPFEVEVALEPDPAAPGKPLWSTGRQPSASIDSGTLSEGRFTVRRMPLLALAIPALKYRDTDEPR